LSAIVNCSKHRNLILSRFWINLDKNKEYSAKSLELCEFKFKENNYAQKRVIEFIKNEDSRIGSQVIEIGMEVNKFVKHKLINRNIQN
jgi:CRISPR/Cas system CSM-associated protein Csm5 (group 7 of RAMP superfamily)